MLYITALILIDLFLLKYNCFTVLLVSDAQQSKSALCIHISSPSLTYLKIGSLYLFYYLHPIPLPCLCNHKPDLFFSVNLLVFEAQLTCDTMLIPGTEYSDSISVNFKMISMINLITMRMASLILKICKQFVSAGT